MTRYSRSTDTHDWLCPLCLAHGIYTVTTAPTDEAGYAVDDGSTELLYGALCGCCAEMVEGK